MKLKKVIAAMGLATAASSPFAAVLDFGDVGSVSGGTYFAQGFVEHTPGAFTDYLLFSLSSPIYDAWIGLGTVADQPKVDGSNITGMTASLFADFGAPGFDAADVLLADLGSGDYISNGGPLFEGAYYFKVSGVGVGPSISSYSYTATVTPVVPEPETYAMMLAGLGMLGGIAVRRRGRRD